MIKILIALLLVASPVFADGWENYSGTLNNILLGNNAIHSDTDAIIDTLDVGVDSLRSLSTLLQEAEQEIYEIEHHLHNRERWLGRRATITQTYAAQEDTNAGFVAISGDNAFGTDAGDTVIVIGTGDTPVIAGMAYFDLHELYFTGSSSGTSWRLRILYGSAAQTPTQAGAAGQYSDSFERLDTGAPPTNAGTPVVIMMPRVPAGYWVRAIGWNATNNATLTFLVGVHEYAR